jgi:hypothetical protein
MLRFVRRDAAASGPSTPQALEQGQRVTPFDRVPLAFRQLRVSQLLDHRRGLHKRIIGSKQNIARRRHGPQCRHRWRGSGACGVVVKLAQFRQHAVWHDLAGVAPPPTVSAMRPASIGVAPPPWEKIHRIFGCLARVPLMSRLAMARVESNGYSMAWGRKPGITLPQHAAEVG